MKILMIGWEFPPYIAGGLGVHLYEVSRILGKKEKLTLVLPDYGEFEKDGYEIIKVKRKLRFGPYSSIKGEKFSLNDFNYDLLNAVMEYNENVVKEVLSRGISFDVIHAHDWITFPSGIKLKKLTGKPLIVSVHSTEYNRSPFPWDKIVEIERAGMENADLVITVSNYMKKIIMEKYGIPENKIRVIYNGINYEKYRKFKGFIKSKDFNVVTFIGRIAWQKGVEFFLKAAKRVLDVMKNVRFFVVGRGPDLERMINLAIDLGIIDNVFFTGFVPEEEKIAILKISDVVVVPSVSEPFGIVPLEAVASGVPVILSKQSGVSEIFNHCFKVDYWDTELMANYIISILRYKELKDEMSKNAFQEIENFTWDKVVDKIIEVYKEVIRS